MLCPTHEIPDTLRRIENVLVTGRLSDVLSTADVSVPNVIPVFMSLPGELALQKSDGELEYLSSYSLSQSWCTPDALKHLDATTEHLRHTRQLTSLTSTGVLQNIRSVTQDPSPRLCWLDSGLSGINIGEVLKFEFTSEARTTAVFQFVMWALGISVLAHLVLTNLYYRGVVYVICGPKRHRSVPPASSAV
jgi:hypothetical protein